MDRVYESQYHDWLSVHGGLAIMEQHGRSRAWEVIVIARRERERERPSGFSPMVPLGDRAMEMATRCCLIEAAGGAPMGRWFWVRG
jgi:hypothetical protein